MGDRIHVYGGTIELRADPARSKTASPAGKLVLACRNGSKVRFHFQVNQHISTDLGIATCGFASGAPGPVGDWVPGRTGFFAAKLSVDVGEWHAIRSGGCYVIADTTVTLGTNAPNSSPQSISHVPSHQVVVK